MYQDNLVLYFICVHYCLRKKADNFVVKAIISWKFYFETSECRLGAWGKLRIRLFTNFIVCSYHCPFPNSKSPGESGRFIYRENKGIASTLHMPWETQATNIIWKSLWNNVILKSFKSAYTWIQTLSLPATCVWLWARWLILQHLVIYMQ